MGHCLYGTMHPLAIINSEGGRYALYCTRPRFRAQSPAESKLDRRIYIYIYEQLASIPNMNATGRLPSIAMIHLGMIIRLTNTVEAPEAVTDSTGEIIGIDLDPDESSIAAQQSSPNESIRILHKFPTVTVRLHNVKTEFLPPIPCAAHSVQGPRRDCKHCDFRAGCVAVQPQLSRRSFPVDINDPVSGTMFTLNVQRKQLPMTIKTASTLHTLQGVTADPGLIFHWKFPRFFSEELQFDVNYGRPCVNFSNSLRAS